MYRLLELGEITRDGDEEYARGKWWGIDPQSEFRDTPVVESDPPIRRKIEGAKELGTKNNAASLKLLHELAQIKKELLPGTPAALQMGLWRLGCLIEQQLAKPERPNHYRGANMGVTEG